MSLLTPDTLCFCDNLGYTPGRLQDNCWGEIEWCPVGTTWLQKCENLFPHGPWHSRLKKKELSVDCSNCLIQYSKRSKQTRQKRHFLPSLPAGPHWQLFLCTGGTAIKASFDLENYPQVWCGDKNSFQKEGNGNSECPFLQMKQIIQRPK